MTDLSDIPPLDWAVARKRILAAGIFLGASDHAEKIAAQTDDQFNEDMAFINFARTFEISIDWLVTGEGMPMLDPERARRHPKRD